MTSWVSQWLRQTNQNGQTSRALNKGQSALADRIEIVCDKTEGQILPWQFLPGSFVSAPGLLMLLKPINLTAARSYFAGGCVFLPTTALCLLFACDCCTYPAVALMFLSKCKWICLNFKLPSSKLLASWHFSFLGIGKWVIRNYKKCWSSKCMKFIIVTTPRQLLAMGLLMAALHYRWLTRRTRFCLFCRFCPVFTWDKFCWRSVWRFVHFSQNLLSCDKSSK